MDGTLQTCPSLAIELVGTCLPPPFARTVSTVLVRQVLGAPTAAEIDFTDPEPALAGTLRIGADLRIRAGPDALFVGRIAALAHRHDAAKGLLIRVRAYDPLHAARRRYRVRALENASAATLAQELAAELALGFVSVETPPTRNLVIQHGESDLELLGTLAAAAGLYPFVYRNELRLLTLGGHGDDLPLRLGRGLFSFTVEASDEAALRRVETHAWDSSTLATFTEAADTARQDAFELRDIGLDSSRVSAERLLFDRLVESASQAEALAQATLDRAAATETVVHGVATGSADLTPGRAVRLEGGAFFTEGRYVVTTALHRFSAEQGYTVAFSTEPPKSRERPRHPVVTHGKVSDLRDPEDAGRCRVTLDSLGGLDTGWLQVVVPGAGKGKGLAAFPDRGDAVLVILPDADPTRGFVLGGLYGGQLLPRGVGVRANRPFVLRTGGGQMLELAHDAALARISTANGNLIELTPNRMRLAAATDMVIEAPGRTITIRANEVNFEQG